MSGLSRWWKRNEDTVKQVARGVIPVAASAFGGPLAGVAAAKLTQALGGDPEHPMSPAEIEERLASGQLTGEQLVALKRADHELERELAQIGVDRDKLEQMDRASARKMGVARGLGFQVFLSVLFIGGYFAVLGVMVHQLHDGFAAQQDGVLALLLGVMTGAVKDIIQFWFGSSFGSRTKDEALRPAQ